MKRMIHAIEIVKAVQANIYEGTDATDDDALKEILRAVTTLSDDAAELLLDALQMGGMTHVYKCECGRSLITDGTGLRLKNLIAEELDRRYDDIKSGKVKLIPGEEVEAHFRELHERIEARRKAES
jgi:hypothetical protein